MMNKYVDIIFQYKIYVGNSILKQQYSQVLLVLIEISEY